MAKYGTKSLKAVFCVIVVTACHHCRHKQVGEGLDEDAGSFQDVKDQDDVVDSEQRVVVYTELDDNHLSGEGK